MAGIITITDASDNIKPDPQIALKYEKLIMSCCFFLTLDSCLLLLAGGLATRWFTSFYLGALGAALSILSAGYLLFMHKKRDAAWRGTRDTTLGSISISTSTSTSTTADLLHGAYPPMSRMPSIVSNVLITIVWYMGTFTTIVYHASLRAGKLTSENTKRHYQGPLSSWGELALGVLCTAVATLLLVLQLCQRRATSREMLKAIVSRELEY